MCSSSCTPAHVTSEQVSNTVSRPSHLLTDAGHPWGAAMHVPFKLYDDAPVDVALANWQVDGVYAAPEPVPAHAVETLPV